MKLKINRLIRQKFAVLALLASSSIANAAVNVTADISADTTWSLANSPYVLKDYIFVVSPATLTIEAGVTVQADQGSANAAPALIVTQGAKITAIGTAAKPIVFTSVLDNPLGTLTKDDKGKWGGLIILGNAPINSNGGSNANTDPMTNAIEGVPTTSGISNRSIPASYAQYGGNVAADNSGTLKYVSIRHGGAEIGSGNEINGLTMGGVGSGTTIEYIDVFANKDDGIEFFGGTVNAKYLSVAYVGDDSFDFDEGYTGWLQFLFTVADKNSNRGVEWDGSTESDDIGVTTNGLTPWSDVRIANMTAIGSGTSITNVGGEGNTGMEIRDNGGGQVWNSIVTNFGKGIFDIEDTSGSKGTASNTTNNRGSQALLENGALAFKGNIFFQAGDFNNTAAGTAEETSDTNASAIIFAAANANSFNVDPLLLDVSSLDGVVSPFPYDDTNATYDSPALTGAQTFDATNTGTGKFTQTTYRGAFAGTSDNWLAGWTAIGSASATSGTSPILIADSNASDSSSSSSTASYNLIGISTRGLVSSTNSMYGSIAIEGTGNKTIAFMGKGETMTAQGVTNYVADPKIEIWRQVSGQWELYKSNDNWASASASEIITTVTGKTGITLPVGANEAAIVLSLAPGNYSAILKSDSSTAQEALVEAYEIAN